MTSCYQFVRTHQERIFHATILQSHRPPFLSRVIDGYRSIQMTRPYPVNEGAGGLLTVPDTEESPLSTTQVARFTPRIREGRPCRRNEPWQVCAMNLKGRGRLLTDGTNTPTGASPNSPDDERRRGTGRMLS